MFVSKQLHVIKKKLKIKLKMSFLRSFCLAFDLYCVLGIWLLKAGVLNEHVLSQLNSAFYRQNGVIIVVLNTIKSSNLALCPPRFGVFGIGGEMGVGLRLNEHWRQ